MVRYIACNSKAVSFSSACICPWKVFHLSLYVYHISQPNHLHLLLYNNFTKLYTVFNKFLKFLLLTSFISVFCVFYFLLTVRVELTNYTSRANIYFDCSCGYSTVWDTRSNDRGWIRTNICLGYNLLIYSQLKPYTCWAIKLITLNLFLKSFEPFKENIILQTVGARTNTALPIAFHVCFDDISAEGKRFSDKV